jgi:hypothetical protein
MHVTTKITRLALGAAVAGMIAGLSGTAVHADDADKEQKVESNGCGGANGCGAAEKGEANGCGGHGADQAKAKAKAKADADGGDANSCGGSNGCGANE